ncbi:unnamed protein product [Adineta ricciae]|uniref:Uncharacterized protein n=1 Tax=Adineta ricciae TaxID=249248 RepID=A0A813VQZ5_ADIRI|nr:unnamed protein product [Adineta ricciae]CAF1011796.1 unnamed protein product [Adineta ricciae]
MPGEDRLGDAQSRSKARRKSKGPAQALDGGIEDELDAMLDSASKVVTRTAASSKQKPVQKPAVEATGGWSNDANNDDDQGDIPIEAAMPRRSITRRAPEEIVAADIPTIPMDDADDDERIDMAPETEAAPEFSVHQIATFKEIEKEFSRTRASQYIDPKIDIGILYHNLNLQEEIDTEDRKVWDWDKLFVEVRNAITNPIIE